MSDSLKYALCIHSLHTLLVNVNSNKQNLGQLPLTPASGLAIMNVLFNPVKRIGMATLATSSQYKDQAALSIDSELLRAVILPQKGANLAALIHKSSGKQLLFQRPGAEFSSQPYAGTYTSAENAGMDDMFPTIDACFMHQFPWEGVLLPDHGEVWSLPWQVQESNETLRLSVHGVRLPYTLEKELSFSSPGVLHIHYKLTNHSPFPFDYQWAAHCMLNCDEGSQILLPEETKRLTIIFSNESVMGSYGDSLDFPIATLRDGSQRDMRIMRPTAAQAVCKYYLNDVLCQGWCAVKMPQSQVAVGFSWPVEKVPYLALLPNEGGWDNASTMHIEPTTSTFDRPDLGKYHNQVSCLGGFSQQEWYLNISVTSKLEFSRINTKGFFN